MGNFTRNKTQFTKGIAIILMIIHHLFWNVEGIGIKINGITLSQRLAIIGKVCVSIFLILSGYGLYKVQPKVINLKKYYFHRLIKIYSNYLFIIIMSLAIGYMFFSNSMLFIIGTGIKGVIKVILTFTGLQFIIGYRGFNPSWWFITVIVYCYIIYPYVSTKITKNGMKFVGIYFVISFLNLIPMEKIKVFNILFWGFPFVLGIYLAYSDLLYRSYKFLNNKIYRKVYIVGILFCLCLIRQSMKNEIDYAIRLDWILATVFIINVNLFYDKNGKFKKIFCFLGDLSMDMYYIHMFITTYFLREITYSFGNPILISLFAIMTSVVCTLFINKIKKYVKFKEIIIKFERCITNCENERIV